MGSVLLAGVAMTGLLYAVLSTIARAGRDAKALAERATAELRAQLSFTQQLIEAIPSPVFFKDVQGRYLGCNRAFEDYAGLTRAELIGKTVRDVASADFAERSLESDRATAFHEEAVAQEMNMSTVDANEGVAAFVERRDPTYRGW